MKKILILFPAILLIIYIAFNINIFQSKSERLKHKFIKLALENENIEYKTEFTNTKYICYFGSLYSIKDIKPELKRINAHYSPLIWIKMRTMRVGEGASSVVIVKHNGEIFPVYLEASNIITDDKPEYDRRCIPSDTINLRIENKKLYVTH